MRFCDCVRVSTTPRGTLIDFTPAMGYDNLSSLSSSSNNNNVNTTTTATKGDAKNTSPILASLCILMGYDLLKIPKRTVKLLLRLSHLDIAKAFLYSQNAKNKYHYLANAVEHQYYEQINLEQEKQAQTWLDRVTKLSKLLNTTANQLAF